MNKKRCHWAENTFATYEAYHDNEWGEPFIIRWVFLINPLSTRNCITHQNN